MTPLEAQALLIRHKAACELLRTTSLDGPRLLSMVVLPDEDILRASMVQAREDGVSLEALKMVGRNPRLGDGDSPLRGLLTGDGLPVVVDLDALLR